MNLSNLDYCILGFLLLHIFSKQNCISTVITGFFFFSRNKCSEFHNNYVTKLYNDTYFKSL
jgi:hypothetical protein